MYKLTGKSFPQTGSQIKSPSGTATWTAKKRWTSGWGGHTWLTIVSAGGATRHVLPHELEGWAVVEQEDI